MIRAIILPGMDGTGDLLAEFAAALAPELEASIVAYPKDVVLDYPALTALVAESLPREGSFVLIAESFSGPIAIELAATKPEGLIGLVLIASYARAPRSRALRWLQRVLPARKLPLWPVMPMLMGRWSSPQWRLRVRDAVRSVDAKVMRARLQAAASIDVTAKIAEIDCPLMYLRASDDRLVKADSWRAIRDISGNAVCIEIEGPHFLLQAKPEECAAAIK